MASFQLGMSDGDHLLVNVIRRQDEQDDWLDALVTVRAGAFSAQIPVDVSTCDFPPFRHQLELLFQTLSGKAVFFTVEQQLAFTCTGNAFGGVHIEGLLKDRVSDGNELRFQIAIDQTFLSEAVSGLRSIEAEFPNILHPPFSQ